MLGAPRVVERGDRQIDEVVTKATFAEIDEQRAPQGFEIDWSQLRQFRFTVQHLLAVTAALAIALTVYLRLGVCMTLFLGVLAAIGIGWRVTTRAERRVAEERERRRQEFLMSRTADVGVAAALPQTPPAAAAPPRRRPSRCAGRGRAGRPG